MADTEIALPDDFASTMQELVAEAERTISSKVDERDAAPAEEVRSGFAAVNARIAALEETISVRLERMAANFPAQESPLAQQLERVDENLRGLRATESVNQRLFNSLHEELKNYRDNFLRESLQKPFIRDLIVLFDDLSGLLAQMQSGGISGKGKGMLAQWSSNLENAIHSVLEILHRLEVSEIEAKDMVDRVFHRVVNYEPAEFAEDDGRIVMRLKRGFLWRDQVLRAEEVVAKRFN